MPMFKLVPVTQEQKLLQQRMDEQYALFRETLQYTNFIYPALLAYLENLLLVTEHTSGKDSFEIAIVLDLLLDTQRCGRGYIRKISYLENTQLHLRLVKLCRAFPGRNNQNLIAAYSHLLANRSEWKRNTGEDIYLNALLTLKEEAFGVDSLPAAETLVHILNIHTCEPPNRKYARLEGETLVPDYQRFVPVADRILNIYQTALANMKAGLPVAFGDVSPSWVTCGLWNAIGYRQRLAQRLGDVETAERMDALYDERRRSRW